MLIGQFQPVTRVIGTGIGQFAPSGQNAGFCEAILQKNRTGASPLRLESLHYTLPAAEQQEAQNGQQPLVVNLLMQLRAYHDQSNTFLHSQMALNLQLTQQLRQALSTSNGAVRARAGEIERAIRGNLYRSGEFQRAMHTLVQELKKNDNRSPELTVQVSGPRPASDAPGRKSSPAALDAWPRARLRKTPDLRAFVFPGEIDQPPRLPPVIRSADAFGEGDGRRRENSGLLHRARAADPDGKASAPEQGRRSGKQAKADLRADAEPAGAPPGRREANRSQVNKQANKQTTRQARKHTSKQADTQANKKPFRQEQAQSPRLRENRGSAQQEQGQTASHRERQQSLPAAEHSRTAAPAAVEIAQQPVEKGRESGKPSLPGGVLHQNAQSSGMDFPMETEQGRQMRLLSVTGRMVPAKTGRIPVSGMLRGWPGGSFGQGTMAPWLRGAVPADGGSAALFRGWNGLVSASAGPYAPLRYRATEPAASGAQPVPGWMALSAGTRFPVRPVGGVPMGSAAVQEIRPQGSGGSADVGGETFSDSNGPRGAGAVIRRAVQHAVSPPRMQTFWHREAGWADSGLRNLFPASTERGEDQEPIQKAVLLSRPGSYGHAPAAVLHGRSVLGGTLVTGGVLGNPAERSGRQTGAPASGRIDARSRGPEMDLGQERHPVIRRSPTGEPEAGKSVVPALPHGSVRGRLPDSISSAVRHPVVAGEYAPGAVARAGSVFAGTGGAGIWPAGFARWASYARNTGPGTDGRNAADVSPVLLTRSAGFRETPASTVHNGSPSVVRPAESKIAGGVSAYAPRFREPVRGGVPGGMGSVHWYGGSRMEEGLWTRVSGMRALVWRAQQAGTVAAPLPELRSKTGPALAFPANGPAAGIRRRYAFRGNVRNAAGMLRRETGTGTYDQAGSSERLPFAAENLTQLRMPEQQSPFFRALRPPVSRRAESGVRLADGGQIRSTMPADGGPGEMHLLSGPDPSEAAREGMATVIRQASPSAPVIHRQPARQERSAPDGSTGERSGEEILKAQTVTPAQAAALSAAYSYSAEPPGGAQTQTPITQEQEERIAERILSDLNYNRMAAEVLDRVERRLRAERRKFGR